MTPLRGSLLSICLALQRLLHSVGSSTAATTLRYRALADKEANRQQNKGLHVLAQLQVRSLEAARGRRQRMADRDTFLSALRGVAIASRRTTRRTPLRRPSASIPVTGGCGPAGAVSQSVLTAMASRIPSALPAGSSTAEPPQGKQPAPPLALDKT